MKDVVPDISIKSQTYISRLNFNDYRGELNTLKRHPFYAQKSSSNTQNKPQSNFIKIGELENALCKIAGTLGKAIDSSPPWEKGADRTLPE